MRPASIVQFERLYMLKILCGLVIGFWAFASVSDVIAPPDAPALMHALMPYIMIGSVVVGVAINILLLYFVARRGSDVARWIFVILFAIGAAGVVRGFAQPSHLPMALRALGLGQLLIEIAMTVLLFRPDAKSWFATIQRVRR